MAILKSRYDGCGPFRVDQLRPGDRYELHDGHAIYCPPSGPDRGRRVGMTFNVLATDPLVTEAGVDVGYALDDRTLRAPDVAIGHVPDQTGWVTDGAPLLAVEHAGPEQDEASLQEKVDDFLRHGTRFVWVIRLTEPHRVEVYEPQRTARHVDLDGVLEAPGVLEHAVPVRALFDRELAHELMLRNLLQRRGYAEG